MQERETVAYRMASELEGHFVVTTDKVSRDPSASAELCSCADCSGHLIFTARCTIVQSAVLLWQSVCSV